ncbi:hypothetical protein EMIHUDRAFT_437128, partial [Emiliania huxleyi CCMP1516]|uniref:Uncharacterized protein n=2 Tax=Emiliania huxleyi TaxID=2903 RepID=A0A0D3IQP2_EMIH1
MVVAASSAAALHRMSSQLVAAVERHSVRVRPAGAPIHAADGELLFSLLGELRLDSHEPLLRELPSVAPGTTPCPADVGAAVDLRAFVGAVGASAAANPLLCILAERLSSSAVPSELDDESAYQLVHHCLLLDLVTRALAADPELAAAVYARARGTVHATEGWWRPLGIFELAKLKTVEMTLERFVEHRRAGNLPANFGHIGLPFNILEAVMQEASPSPSPRPAWGPPGRRAVARRPRSGRRALCLLPKPALERTRTQLCSTVLR